MANLIPYLTNKSPLLTKGNIIGLLSIWFDRENCFNVILFWVTGLTEEPFDRVML